MEPPIPMSTDTAGPAVPDYRTTKVKSSTVFESVVLAMLIIIAGLTAWNTLRPEPDKWDYKIESIPDANFTSALNTLGQDGWELVFARRASTGEPAAGSKTEFSYEMIFKRRAR